jgi:threonine aldolase
MNNTLLSDRRNFLKAAGLGSLSFMLPGVAAPMAFPSAAISKGVKYAAINFMLDGLSYSPEEYLETLLKVNKTAAIGPDIYGRGGTTAELEEAFAKLTGKEKAIFLPTGTMANEEAIRLLAGDNPKIVVPENSHIYRDEADAAQVVHNKRLIPAGAGKPYFDVEELDRVIAHHRQGEVFPGQVGAVSVECPVRRADGTAVPLEVLKDISNYCRENGYGLHLDGARLHLASAWTGVSIETYASLFDTVYISQYKYLNAAFGAVLCGPAALIDQFPLLSKLHGGAVLSTWPATAMALHHLNTIEVDLQQARQAGDDLIIRLNAIDGLSITPLPEGTNVYTLKTAPHINPRKLTRSLFKDHNIWVRYIEEEEVFKIKINASILRQTPGEIAMAWKDAVEKSRS